MVFWRWSSVLLHRRTDACAFGIAADRHVLIVRSKYETPRFSSLDLRDAADRLRSRPARARSEPARFPGHNTRDQIVLDGIPHHPAEVRCGAGDSICRDLDEEIGRRDHAPRRAMGFAAAWYVGRGCAAQGWRGPRA